MKREKIILFILGVICAMFFIFFSLRYGVYTMERDREALIQFKYEHAVRP